MISAASLVIASSVFSSLAFASVTIDWVTVGNVGNAADNTGFGAVGYAYRIGKYEVTNAQYCAFLNAVAKTDSYELYNASMSITRSGSSGNYSYSVPSDLANRPVVHVSWFDAARFVNWMANGQGGGGTETGAYTLNGATSGTILVNAGAQIYIPSENEWYKAAYYNGATSTYSLYPNGQNTITTADANYANSVGSTTNVGAYSGDPSFYGTFDQGGNAVEWNDGVIGSSRGLRGGAWYSPYLEFSLQSTYRDSYNPSNNLDFVMGFRVASAIPDSTPSIVSQPSSLNVNVGANATFSISANGTNLSYQWYKNGSAISGATASSYNIPKAQASDAGNYTVTVFNSAGGVSSTAANLTVSPTPPSITSDLSTVSIPKGKLMPRFTITTNFGAKIFAAKGLPRGLKLTSRTGVISGKPTRTGTYTVTLVARKMKGKKVEQQATATKVVIVY